MCSETSPRISFSNDLVPQDDQVRRDIDLLESNSDFEFSICSSLGHQSSSADELFADGIILPAAANQTHPRNVSLPPIPCNSKREEDRSILNPESEEKIQSKSFWGFKRSSSLNCDIKKTLICSLPLLSRSNSTGSAPNPNSNPKQKASSCKEFNKQKQQLGKKVAVPGSNYVYSLPQKPPLKKYYGGSNGNGVNKVLNVPPPYIGKGAASLFGLGSFLRNGKEKTRR
ncbi:uncharacterized protein [Euphorbia lathyris]|uniref:uncharacterized protein n=1 Tax=Euphorbia lathyris TaxID=212925 RepID=UPI003313CC10